MSLKKRIPLCSSALLLTALALPMTGMAQTAKERELEARMAQLEQQIQLLLEQQETLRAEIQSERDVPPAVVAEPDPRRPAPIPAPSRRPPLPAGQQPIQAVTITPGATPGTTFKFGGYIKTDFIATRTGDGQLAESSSARSLYLPGQTPVGGDSSSIDYDAHAKFSRFNLAVDSVTEGGDKLGAFFEVDFFGYSGSNFQTSTNSYGLRLRHAYVYWNNWMFGQNWTNFMDLSALPESVDFIGPTDGVLMVRQTQVRYTRGGFSVALENPETTYLNHNTASRSNSDRGWMPDLTLRYGWKGDWGNVSTAAVVRTLRVDNAAAKDTQWAGGVAVSGKWNLGENDDIRYQVSAGRGIGRYIGLGIQSDAMLDGTGDLDTIDSIAGYIGWRHAFNSKLRSNIIYARSDYDIDDIALNPFRSDITKSVQSIRANLYYSPIPKLNFGAELMYGERKVETGDKGDITRLQFTTKYLF